MKEFVCISCPRGCLLHVEGDKVTGNFCKRGEIYGKAEATHPERALSSTVRIIGAKLPYLPVKSAKPIPKDKMFEAMKQINEIVVKAPVRKGDVLLENLASTAIPLIATRSFSLYNKESEEVFMDLKGKVLFASDLHGRRERLKSFLKRIEEEKPDWILMGGDLVYYGPRNGIPEDRDEDFVRQELKALYEKGNFFSVRGNCDRNEDQIPFDLPILRELTYEKKKIALFHGHEESLFALSSKKYDAYLFGHTHLYCIDETKEGLFLNPGSLGFPKENHVPTYMVLEEGWKIRLQRLEDGKTLMRYHAFKEEKEWKM